MRTNMFDKAALRMSLAIQSSTQQTAETFPMCTKCAKGREHLRQVAVITHWERCTLCCDPATVAMVLK